MFIEKCIASFFGIGYIGKGAGSIAAGVSILLLMWIFPDRMMGKLEFAVLVALICIAGIWASSKLVVLWGKDPQKVVIDEVAGMFLSMAGIPLNWPEVLAGFILFRLLDIFKPLGIRHGEKLKDGWGIMADDLIAGFYTNIILRLSIFLGVF
ncbi:MAG: phosphatidylglycerophosphatase A [Saprospiraceae bacterium]|nr:phosphatidylglycerophosphatase A [Saprospiraceae bacterium]